MHPLFPALFVLLTVLLLTAAWNAAAHLRFRKAPEMSTAWLDLDGSARRHRWYA